MVELLWFDVGTCAEFNSKLHIRLQDVGYLWLSPVASFTKEGNPQLAKHPLKTSGHLANHGLTSLVKEATAGETWRFMWV